MVVCFYIHVDNASHVSFSFTLMENRHVPGLVVSLGLLRYFYNAVSHRAKIFTAIPVSIVTFFGKTENTSFVHLTKNRRRS